MLLIDVLTLLHVLLTTYFTTDLLYLLELPLTNYPLPTMWYTTAMRGGGERGEVEEEKEEDEEEKG